MTSSSEFCFACFWWFSYHSRHVREPSTPNVRRMGRAHWCVLLRVCRRNPVLWNTLCNGPGITQVQHSRRRLNHVRKEQCPSFSVREDHKPNGQPCRMLARGRTALLCTNPRNRQSTSHGLGEDQQSPQLTDLDKVSARWGQQHSASTSNGVLRTTGGTDGYAGAALRLQGAGPAEITDIVDSRL